MRKIVEYSIFRAKFVNNYLQEGWELYGNPFVMESSDEWIIMQAMVKYEEVPEHPARPVRPSANPTESIPRSF